MGKIRSLVAVVMFVVSLAFGATAHAALPAPTGLSESVSGSNATVSWAPVAGATGYAVRIHKNGTPYDPCESMLACSQITGTSMTVPVEAGVSYDWWVHAVDSTGLGDSSGRMFTVPGAALRTATITWFANTEADLAGYKLYRAIPCTGALALVKDTGNVVQTTDTLPDGTAEVAKEPHYANDRARVYRVSEPVQRRGRYGRRVHIDADARV